MNQSTVSARGAVNIPVGTDEKTRTIDAVGRLISGLSRENGFGPDDLVHLLFTQTSDLRKMNAAAALRQALPQYASVPLFCSQEPEIEGSPERMIRVLATWRGTGSGKPVYLDEAATLRPDLFGES